MLALREGITDAVELRALQKIPVESPASVSEGPVSVTGTVQPIGPPSTTPLTGGPCVLSKWRVEKFSSDVNDAEPPWKRLAAETDATPLVLETEDGRISVDPTNAKLDFPAGEAQEVARLRPLEKRPENVRSVLESVGLDRVKERDASAESPVLGERRFLQWAVEPGDELFVHGEAMAAAESDVSSADGGLVVGAGGRAGAILSPKSHPTLVNDRSGAVRRAVGGVVLVAGGVCGAVYVLGTGTLPF